MKMKGLFISMLALAALASCSNNGDDMPSAPKKVELSLNLGNVTRALEAPGTVGAPTLSNIQVLFYASNDATGTPVDTRGWTAVTTGGKITEVFTNVSGLANSVRVVANNGKGIVELPTAITSYQGKDIQTAIPMEGYAAIVADATDPGKYKGDINLNFAVARIEVSGFVDGKTNSGDRYEVNIKGVYANNYLTTLGNTTDVYKLVVGTTAGTVKDPIIGMFDDAATAQDWTAAFPADASTAATKCAAYQFFPGIYGMTLLVEVTDNTTSTSTDKFLVIRRFLENGNPIEKLEAGKIYRLNLTGSAIDNTFTPDVDPTTPDPSGDKEVSVNVTVQSWTAVNVTPEL